jgi:hypothetical protein
MTDPNGTASNDQEMARLKKDRPEAGNAVSPTQEQLLDMNPGERWAHEAAQAVDRAGGNQGQFTDNAQLPRRVQQGITSQYEVTDRQLDYDGEFGYPTPT